MSDKITHNKFLIGQSMGSGFSTPGIKLESPLYAIMQVNWTGGSAPTGILKIQESLDNVNWFDIPGATTSVSATPGSTLLKPTAPVIASTWVRLTYAFTSGSATADAFIAAKS